MGKIDDFIKQNNLKSSDCLYHTSRTVKNSKGHPTGSIRVLATKDNKAMVEYKCPACGFEEYIETEWKRPFSIKCGKCGAKIGVPKLKEQAKREMKAGK